MIPITFRKYQKEIFIVSLIIVLILAFLVIKPFLPSVILGAVIAYLFHPFFGWLEKRLKNKPICAVLTLLIITIIFTVPFIFVFKSVVNEVSQFYADNSNGSKEDIRYMLNKDCVDGVESLNCRVTGGIVSFLSDEFLVDNVKNLILDASKNVFGIASSLLFSLPFLILNLLIVIFVIFYLYADWDNIVKEIDILLPFREEIKVIFAKQVRDIIHATVYGTLVVALVQGAIGTIVFIIFDSTKTPFLWGIIMAIAALIPFIGTALVWLPIGVIQVITGHVQGSSTVIWQGMGLLIVGFLLISTIDNFIKPRIIGRRAQIHPLLVLLGVIGGISFFGYIGAIVGPLLMALMVTFIRVYKKEKNAIVG